MNVQEIGRNSSQSCISDEEVDSKGNLKDFVVDDDPVEESEEKKGTKRKESRYKLRPRRGAKGAKKEVEPPKIAKGTKRLRKLTEEEDLFDPEEAFGEMAVKLSGSDTIFGRDNEAKAILAMITQPCGGARPLLVGEAGIGKLSIIKKVASYILEAPKDSIFANRKIYCINCREILSECVAENHQVAVADKLREVIDAFHFDVNDVPVLYFRDIHKLINLEQVTDYVQSILNQPHPFIASISDDIKSKPVVQAVAILAKYNFITLPVEECSIDIVQEIVRHHLSEHPLPDEIEITDNAVGLSVRLAAKYEHSRPFPMKAINLIQECANRILLNKKPKIGEKTTIQVRSQSIAEIVSLKTGVPTEDLLDDSVFNEERFAELLRRKIIGQDHAIELVSQRVASYKMGLLDSRKPWGVFLFVGPTGVGKTELARFLARYLFNNEKNLLIINGSEYKEEYSLSNLIGSAKGYEGNETGGLLTGPLLKNPHQVVLLDEFEKAHVDVRMLFLQVFDQGEMTDRRGMKVDCTQTLFIVTSNVGSDRLFKMHQEGKKMDLQKVTSEIKPLLVEKFTPELCNRFTAIVPFQPLDKKMLPEVARVALHNIAERLLKQAEIELTWSPELVDHFVKSDVDVRFGMRAYCSMIDNAVVSVIKDTALKNKKRVTGRVMLTVKDGRLSLMLNE